METDARGIFDGREFRVKGQAWFEQQYGNMNAPDSGTTRYFLRLLPPQQRRLLSLAHQLWRTGL